MRFVCLAIMVALLSCVLSIGAYAADPATYHLGPNDTITVRVQRHEEFSGDFLIPPDGLVTLPAIGVVPVKGKTLAEVEDLLRTKLASRLQKPEVSVVLRNLRSQNVYVMGAVAKPGMYDINPGWHVAELIAVAGGLNAEPNECTATIFHGSTGQQESLNLAAILKADARANMALVPDDVVSVQRVEQFSVFAVGAVNKPGMYPLKAGAHITDLIAIAGGPSKDLEECTGSLLRKKDGQKLAVKLAAAMKYDPAANLELQNGDVLLVDPPQLYPVCVSGLVKAPGQYLIQENGGIIQAVALAGGLTIQEAETQVSILRDGNRIAVQPYAKLLTADGTTANIKLQRGDTVEVTNLRLIQVTITGEVKQPGTYYITPNQNLLHVIAQAGGVLEGAALNHISIRQPDGQTASFDLTAAVMQGKVESAPVLVSGELVLIPKITDRIIVLGAVKTPGYYPLPLDAPAHLSDALALAGGQVVKSRLKQVAIVRRTAPEKEERIVVDYAKFLSAGDARCNPKLNAGDVIYVPEANTLDMGAMLSAISTFAVLNSSLK